MRGDKQREKKAGRKRIDREYRKKGPRETSISKEIRQEDFSELEYNVLFNLNKKKAYGDNSTDLTKIVRMRNIKPSSIPQFMEDLIMKLEQRDWGTISEGDDGKTYISLNLEKKETIEMYIEINRP